MSELLEYKNYYGSVLFSAEDDLLYGKLIGLRDTILYDGKDVEPLRRNFCDAVDGYLEFCKEEGREPNVPYKGSFNVRVTPDMHRRVVQLAERNHKKLNTVVNEALEAYLAKAS